MHDDEHPMSREVLGTNLGVEMALACEDGSIGRHTLFIWRVLGEPFWGAHAMAVAMEGQSLPEHAMRYIAERWAA